ncbi:MAG: SDR family oxidoreductase [Prevotellaceae bacterium]|jgi:NAD(P)-dependent dehydrogenase (short-subunit alcohol dehydrogenase family)|nr:SDR family oxidoreductase [Prevotellaceae bacterium]
MNKKIILITGAFSGLGKTCAEYLAQKGFIVYGADRKVPAGNSSPSQPQVCGEIAMLHADITKPETIQAAVQTIIDEHGRIDVVINNAGMGIGGALELATPEEIGLQMNTNFMGTVNVCNAVIPHLRNGGGGKIINLSSIGGMVGIPFQGFYSASKFAIEGYSEALSLELHPFKIQVVLIEPGDFATGFTAARIVSEQTKNSEHYGEKFAKCMAIIEKEENGGCKPIKLAKAMRRIVKAKRPKFRYKVGNMVQTNFARSKAFIPSRTYQALLRFFYKL